MYTYLVQTNNSRVVKPTNETYEEWQLAYDHFNEELFDGMLPFCLLTFQREKHTMGYFSHDRFSNRLGRKTDEIALNPSFFAVCPINEALQTLVHEMTHQWQAHFGKPGRGRYHNKNWADKMESIGLIPSSTGKSGGKRTGDSISDYILPGGKLEQSIKRLREKGFVLQWMDRYVAKPMQNLDPYFQISSGQSGVDIPGLESTNLDDDIDTETLAEIQAVAEVVELDFTRSIQKQGTRVKYSCDCGINLWAKPGIEVTCNTCECLFEAVG